MNKMETLKAIVQYKPPVDDSKCENLYSVSVNKGEDRALKGRRALAKEVGGEQGGGRTHTKEMGEDSWERGRQQQKWVAVAVI